MYGISIVIDQGHTYLDSEFLKMMIDRIIITIAII